MEEIEGFRYRCRVSVLHHDLSVLCYSGKVRVQKGMWLRWFPVSEAERALCLCVGRHALSDQAGSEGGQTEGDQAGAAKF